jgi:hypothetical protein
MTRLLRVSDQAKGTFRGWITDLPSSAHNPGPHALAHGPWISTERRMPLPGSRRSARRVLCRAAGVAAP